MWYIMLMSCVIDCIPVVLSVTIIGTVRVFEYSQLAVNVMLLKMFEI